MQRTLWMPGLIMFAVAVAVTAVAYPFLPDPIPSHWNAAGEVDDTIGKPWGAVIMPGAMLITWLLFLILPAISPKGFRMSRFINAYAAIVNTMIGFELLVAMLVLAAALGYPVAMERVIPAAVGILLIVIGNYLGKTTKNFFLGVRTPWTLASDEVWRRTHRLAGWLLVIAGVAMIVLGLSGIRFLGLFVGVVAAAALIPVVYSYLIYRRIEGFADNGQNG